MIAAQPGVFGDETAYTVTIGLRSAEFASMDYTRPMRFRILISYGGGDRRLSAPRSWCLLVWLQCESEYSTECG